MSEWLAIAPKDRSLREEPGLDEDSEPRGESTDDLAIWRLIVDVELPALPATGYLPCEIDQIIRYAF